MIFLDEDSGGEGGGEGRKWKDIRDVLGNNHEGKRQNETADRTMEKEMEKRRRITFWNDARRTRFSKQL